MDTVQSSCLYKQAAKAVPIIIIKSKEEWEMLLHGHEHGQVSYQRGGFVSNNNKNNLQSILERVEKMAYWLGPMAFKCSF